MRQNNLFEALFITATPGRQCLSRLYSCSLVDWKEIQPFFFFFTALREKAISMNNLSWKTHVICFFSHICECRFLTPSKRNSTMSTGLPWLQALKTSPNPWICPSLMSARLPSDECLELRLRLLCCTGYLLSLFYETFSDPPIQNYSIFCEFPQKDALLRAFYYVLPLSVFAYWGGYFCSNPHSFHWGHKKGFCVMTCLFSNSCWDKSLP